MVQKIAIGIVTVVVIVVNIVIAGGAYDEIQSAN